MSVPRKTLTSRYTLLASLVKKDALSWESYAGPDNQPNDYCVVIDILDILDAAKDEIPPHVADMICDRVADAYSDADPFGRGGDAI